MTAGRRAQRSAGNSEEEGHSALGCPHSSSSASWMEARRGLSARATDRVFAPEPAGQRDLAAPSAARASLNRGMERGDRTLEKTAAGCAGETTEKQHKITEKQADKATLSWLRRIELELEGERLALCDENAVCSSTVHILP